MHLLGHEPISNNAAGPCRSPSAWSRPGVSERPFIMGVAPAASYAFASPIGYQTHMMVFGPGGYRFADFLEVDIPPFVLQSIVTGLEARIARGRRIPENPRGNHAETDHQGPLP
jgi:hypothetical protein